MSFTITDALKWWARDQPDNMAIRVGERQVTFKELRDQALEVSRGLTDLGVKPGDRITVVAQNSLEFCILMFASLHTGTMMAPLNWRLTEAEIAGSLEDFEPAVVFADTERMEMARAAVARTRDVPVLDLSKLADLRRPDDGRPMFQPDMNTPIVIISTSGSTARPKGVIHTHFGMLTYAFDNALIEPRCTRGSTLLLVNPLSAASGFDLVYQFITVGSSIILEQAFEAKRALEILVKDKVNNFQGTPIFFERIAALPEFKDADLSSLYFAQSGGATVTERLLHAWLEKGVTLPHLYGQTEIGGGWGARDDTATTQLDVCGRGGVFNEPAIMGEDGQLAAAGEPGEIVYRGPSGMIGYWKNPEATAATIKDGWLHTGDLGTQDAGGNLRFLARTKDMIISGGLNISAAEIEKVLAGLAGVEESAVIATPDAKFGETPLAVIYDPEGALTEAKVVAHCNAQLANFKVPRYVVLTREPLPRLHTGKIAKPKLRDDYKDAEGRLERVR